MGRRSVTGGSVRPAPFPRPGEPIVPRLLEEVVAGRRAAPGDHALDLVRASELGATVWRHHPEETCRQLAMLRGLPGAAASPSFVADLLSQLPTFRWVDRRRGWFALGGATGV